MDRQKTLEREARCIQDEPPGCSATCPVHVDVRTLIAKLRGGDPARRLLPARRASARSPG